MEPENDIVTEGNRAGEARQDRLWFLESLDQINRAVQDTDHFEQVSHVLDAVLAIFECDRAWIVYPCDPESRTCRTVGQPVSFIRCEAQSLDPTVPPGEPERSRQE